MTGREILPYFHPTTVAFVDDDAYFLDNLSLQLDAHLAYRLFPSASHALRQLNSTVRSRTLSERFFAAIENTPEPSTDRLLRLDLATIQKEARNTERFAETAVLVVDFAMPEMDGLEFCRQIDNCKTRKILFTGVADEAMAIQAFNDGIIDRYIRKSSRNVYEEVNEAIDALQKDYLRDVSHAVHHVLALHNESYLTDPVFAYFFANLLDKNGFIEYYMAAEPGGFLFLDAEGNISRLIVLTADELDMHHDVAKRRGAPPALLEALASHKHVPLFNPLSGGFFEAERDYGIDCTYPAMTLAGHQQYYWALVTGEQARVTCSVSSYNSYLDWLDTTTWRLS